MQVFLVDLKTNITSYLGMTYPFFLVSQPTKASTLLIESLISIFILASRFRDLTIPSSETTI